MDPLMLAPAVLTHLRTVSTMAEDFTRAAQGEGAKLGVSENLLQSQVSNA